MHNKNEGIMNKEKVEKKNVENNVAKEVNKEREAIENLRVQLRDHLDKADYHKTMATKAQGALEVLQQLYPEENKEN